LAVVAGAASMLSRNGSTSPKHTCYFGEGFLVLFMSLFCWYQVHLLLKFAINHKAAKICLHRHPHAPWASVQPPSQCGFMKPALSIFIHTGRISNSAIFSIYSCFIAKWFVSMHTIEETGIANQ